VAVGGGKEVLVGIGGAVAVQPMSRNRSGIRNFIGNPLAAIE